MDLLLAVTDRKNELMYKFAKADFTPVVDAYEHALFGQKPCSEYYPGIQDLAWLTNIIPRPLATFLVVNVIGGKKFYRTPGLKGSTFS